MSSRCDRDLRRLNQLSCFPFVLFSFMACLMKSILDIIRSTGLAFLTVCTAAAAPGTGPGFQVPSGSTLQPPRSVQEDVPAPRRGQKVGYKHVELAGTYDMPAKQFKADWTKRPRPISAHFPYEIS